jgi:hypothetical protein
MLSRLRRVSSAQWRGEALRGAVLLMDGCVAASWFVLLNRPGSEHGPLAALAGVAGLVALAYAASRLVLSSRLPLAGQRALLFALVVLSAAALTRFHTYARIPLTSMAWAGQWLSEWIHILDQLGGGPITLVVTLFCWGKGVGLVYRTVTLDAVSFSFRANVLLMIGAAFLWPPADFSARAVLIYLFFLFGLLATALARVDDIAVQQGGREQPFGLGWAGITIGSALLVTALGRIVGFVYSPAGFGQLGVWLAPAARVLQQALYLALQLVGIILGPLMEFLFNLLKQLMARALEQFELSQRFGLAPTPTPMPQQQAASPIPWGEIMKWSIIAGGILLALVIILFSLRRLQERRPRVSDAERAILPLGDWANDLLANLRAGAENLADALGLLGRFGVGKGLYAAISIRHIYANVARLAAARGQPRRPAITPYEYLPALRRAFAGVDAELARITDAYVGVHYGEAPTRLEELQEIRACWERVRSAEQPASGS